MQSLYVNGLLLCSATEDVCSSAVIVPVVLTVADILKLCGLM
jgi:hypothetical protein